MFIFSTVGVQQLSCVHLHGLPFSCTILESSWSFPEDGLIRACYFPKASLVLTIRWELCRLQGLSKWKLDDSQGQHQQTQLWKSPFFLALVAPLCLLRITAANPCLIPTENLAPLAGLSGELERLIWKITAGSEQTDKQDEMMGYHAAWNTRTLSRYYYRHLSQRAAAARRHDPLPLALSPALLFL